MDINKSVNKRGALDRQDINPSSFRILTGSKKFKVQDIQIYSALYYSAGLSSTW